MSGALPGTSPETQLRRCGALWTKLRPTGEGFISGQSFIWSGETHRKSPLLSTVKISTRQKSLEKADPCHMITCLMVRYRERNIKERNGERRRETDSNKEEGA